MKTLIVIPARYGSTRLPAKPLKPIAGVALLERVTGIAKAVASQTGCRYVVATDHDDIKTFCNTIGAPVVLTDPNLRSGSDRVLAAAMQEESPPDFVINLQGDAPFTEPQHVTQIIEAAAQTDADVITPVIQLDWPALDRLRIQKQATPYSGTTCVRTQTGQALWFSKQILPTIRKEDQARTESPLSPVYRHIGLYGYRLAALQRFAALPASPQEQLEGLEQLRFLENDMTIHAVQVATPRISMSGIDSPEDVTLAEKLIAEHGDSYQGRP